MKINLRLFKKEFLEIEIDREIDPIFNHGEPVAEKKEQLQYVIGDIQYLNLKKVITALNLFSTLKFHETTTEAEKCKISEEYHQGLDIVNGLIKSYEHFKEKREALERE